jgi:hypothetical protein
LAAATDTAQSTVSQALRLLRTSCVITGRPEADWSLPAGRCQSPSRVPPVRQTTRNATVPLSVVPGSGRLAGCLSEEVLLDVGFSDPLGWQPERLRAPDLLSFAGIARAEVPVLPLEQQVAEKVHTYTRRYGRGQPSTRVKDLVELVLVKRSMTLEAARLREALEVTVDRRGGPPSH